MQFTLARQVLCCTLLASLAATLHVASSQNVEVDDSDVIAIIGEDGHVFEKICQTTSSVERIDWLRDGTVVQSMDFPDDSSGPYRSLFLITSDQMSLEKSGPYFCRVRWTGGPFSADISAGTLTVLESSAIVAPSPQYALLGTSISLQCSIPDIDVLDTWRISGSEDMRSEGSTFSSVSYADEGTYTCRLTHILMQMMPVQRDIELKITVIPEITAVPAKLYEFTGDKFNRTISLEFTGRSGDTSTVMWRKDEVPLVSSTNDNFMIVTEYSGNTGATTSLMFTSQFPSRSFRGVYSVVISNDNDVIPESQRSTNFTFQIFVTILPAPVTIVNITSLSRDKARIDWQVEYRHDDEEPELITIYIENHDTQLEEKYHIDDQPSEARSCVVDVVPGAEYWVKLRSMNGDGEHVTERRLFQSDPDAPSVKATSVVRINQTAYKVTTELHYTGGGGIKHFTVSFRVSGQMEWSGATTILAEVVPKSSNLNWTGVIVSSEFAVYSTLEFRVQVTNERGMTTSEAAINELQILPGPPVRIEAVSTTRTSAVLEVQLSPTGTPPLTVEVELTSHREIMCCPNQTTYVGGDTVRFQLEGLTEATTYTVNVYARNLVGKGPGEQHSFETDGNSTALPLWQTVLIAVCTAIVLLFLTVLFCALLCCGCKASCRKWGTKEYHTGSMGLPSSPRELDSEDPVLKRSVRSNGYAASQISYGSHQSGAPMTPRPPTGMSVTSPGFTDFDGHRSFFDDTRTRMSSSTSPFHSSSRAHLTKSSASQGDLYLPNYFDHDETYKSLPRGGFAGTQGSFEFHGLTKSTSNTFYPPPAPKPCATDV